MGCRFAEEGDQGGRSVKEANRGPWDFAATFAGVLTQLQ